MISSSTAEVMMPIAGLLVANPTDFKDIIVRETAVAVTARPPIIAAF
eukprot:CAMPEP_0169161586 /NCGR_PEP_ID=MMETSP1015-20121227/57129_1 /TAXON_ID=342587 /ORGANISM="Karlodinium micrum, Strain CCMP2283" /LENGTH=46 /DNA_ID= /DNA_START= /DNA_END= /DNA_ORIENTATION=